MSHVLDAVIARFVTLYGEPRTDNAEALYSEYVRALKDFDQEALEAAVDEIVRMHTFPTWPTPGEVYKQALTEAAKLYAKRPRPEPKPEQPKREDGRYVLTEEQKAHNRRMIEELKKAVASTALDQHLADPLVLVPLVILDFLCIHPFPDGNGRMARLLTLQLLYHFDYAVGRFISLERIFEESKESYYETLEASSQGWHEGEHNIAPWLDYFWGALLRAYKEFEERVGTIERGRGAKGDRVRAEILKRHLPFSISEIEEACPGISRDMVRVVLRAMKAEGLITPTGKGRSAKWEQAPQPVGQVTPGPATPPPSPATPPQTSATH